MSYRGPRPPDASHYYYFLLYEQSHVINTNQTANYTSPTGSRYQNLSVLTIPLTCTFRINIFKSLPQVFLHENRKYLFWILIYLFKPRAEQSVDAIDFNLFRYVKVYLLRVVSNIRNPLHKLYFLKIRSVHTFQSVRYKYHLIFLFISICIMHFTTGNSYG